MANLKEITVPDIGGFDAVEVIEVLVAPGDVIQAEDSLITLESDKASMEIPAPEAGTIKEVKVKVGDSIAEGGVILTLETAAVSDTDKPAAAADNSTEDETATDTASPEPAAATQAATDTANKQILVPDIGDFDSIPVIDVLVSAGDTVAAEDALITLESDKASMDIPAPEAGVVKEVLVKAGDTVSQGVPILILETTSVAATTEPQSSATETPAAKPASTAPVSSTPSEPQIHRSPAPLTMPPVDESKFGKAHASPSVRKFARELGADLSQINGSAAKGRITKEDVQNYVKQILTSGQPAGTGGTLQVAELPDVDFSAFGDTETQPLTKINKLTGKYLHRSWFYIPHVTQFDEADITDLEAFRKQLSAEYKEKGIKITMIAFLLKAVAAALKEFPRFNASLDKTGENLILKSYYHIGVAVDTPDGLIVPVIKDVDSKNIVELAEAVVDIAGRARKKQIKPTEMQGACFTISSLGGIGGTAFTPIVNQPEVAILGVSRSSMKPVYQNNEFVPRLMLPLSLSYDHRVIDGVAAARFTTYLGQVLADVRRLLL